MVVTGWRFTAVTHIAAHGALLPPARCTTGLTGDHLEYVDGPHDVPAANCQCGYRIVPDLTTLLAYGDQYIVQFRDANHAALTRVQSVGTVVESGAEQEDPEGSYRAAQVRVVGAAVIPGSRLGDTATELLQDAGVNTYRANIPAVLAKFTAEDARRLMRGPISRIGHRPLAAVSVPLGAPQFVADILGENEELADIHERLMSRYYASF